MGSLSAAFVSVAAAAISVRASRKARRIQLYEKRDEVFDAVMGFLVEPAVTGEAHNTQRMLRFLRQTRRVEHLFGDEVGRLRDDIYDWAVKFRRAQVSYKSKPKDDQLFDEFLHCGEEGRRHTEKAKEVFKPYLKVD